MRAARVAHALGLAALLTGCGGSDPEPQYRWEEDTIYEDRGPAPEPRRSYEDDEDDDRPPPHAAAGHYGPRRRNAPRGAIYSPKRGVFCDESVDTCYVAKNAHVGATEQQFGDEAARRLKSRLGEGERGPRAILRPEGGVVCDRQSEVCYDREGASLDRTRREFGRGAAQALADRQGEPRRGPGRRGGMIFSPREGVSCDEQVAACYAGDEAHPGHTKQQFGADAARSVERRSDGGREQRDGIFRPAGGAVCDRLSEVCYDRHGASAKLTREEFGREAAGRMTERLE